MALALRDTRYGSGPVLLCHPGGPGMHPAYLGPLAGIAGADRQVVLLHPRGTGDSPRPADPRAYTIRQYADDLVAWIRRHGDGPVDLLGHSHGGIVAARVAARHPELVRRLVLLGTPAYGGARAAAETERMNRARLGEPACAGALAALEANGAGYPAEPDLGRVIADAVPLWVGPMDDRIRRWQAEIATRPVNLPALRFFNEEIFPTLDDVTKDVGQTTCPVLVVSGDLDSLAGPGHLLEFARVVPAEQVVTIPNSGHMCQVDATEAVNTTIRKFLDDAVRSCASSALSTAAERMKGNRE